MAEAFDFLTVDPNADRNRKTRRLAIALGDEHRVDPVTLALGLMVRLWAGAYREAQDGNLSKWSDAEIAHAAGWQGEPATFVAAIRDAGYLTTDGQLKDWVDWSGRVFERRRYERDRKHRGGSNQPSLGLPGDVPGTSRQGAGKEGRKDEKEGREGSEGREVGAAAEAAPPAGPLAEVVPGSGIRFPVAGKGPGEWELPRPLLEELTSLFPAVDVVRECNLATSKIRRGAVTTKTSRGMPKFLFAWMERAQNSARVAGTSPRGPLGSSPSTTPPDRSDSTLGKALLAKVRVEEKPDGR